MSKVSRSFHVKKSYWLFQIHSNKNLATQSEIVFVNLVWSAPANTDRIIAVGTIYPPTELMIPLLVWKRWMAQRLSTCEMLFTSLDTRKQASGWHLQPKNCWPQVCSQVTPFCQLEPSSKTDGLPSVPFFGVLSASCSELAQTSRKRFWKENIYYRSIFHGWTILWFHDKNPIASKHTGDEDWPRL